MYYEVFGLLKNPFSMTPDPEFLFMTVQHREALTGLTYAILGQKGFLVLTGEAGTGKTTLLARALQHLPPARIRASVILNPMLTPAEFLEMALMDFGITEVPVSKAQRLTLLHQLLLKADAEKRICALIIDEAHKLSAEVLEEIRLLGNFEKGDHKLLQILFLGQTELSELLNRPDLRQLKQRIAAQFIIGPLSGNPEVERYIRYRWTKAGGSEVTPFTAEAVAGIAQYSKGIPRVINAICDNALILAFGDGVNTVNNTHVREACASLNLVTDTGHPGVNGITALPVQPEAGMIASAAKTTADKTTPDKTANTSVQAAVEPEPPRAAEPHLPTLPSLQRYADPAPNQSFFSRWFGKLRLAD